LKLYPYTLGLHQLENVIIIVDVLLSCICNSFVELWRVFSMLTFFKNVLKRILKHVFLQYYAMKSKNLYLLIIYLNNIHGFNTLKYIYGYFLKIHQVSSIGIHYHAYAPRWWIKKHLTFVMRSQGDALKNV
jgi:hypothetical protein